MGLSAVLPHRVLLRRGSVCRGGPPARSLWDAQYGGCGAAQFSEQKVESLAPAPGRSVSGGGVGSLKASYTFLLSLPLRTHELSSPRCLETRIKPDVGSAGFAAEAGKTGRASRHGVGHAGVEASAPSWKASCALGLNLISIPPFLKFYFFFFCEIVMI